MSRAVLFTGTIKRVDKDRRGAVCQGLFKKETDLTPFLGMKVMRSPPGICHACLHYVRTAHPNCEKWDKRLLALF